MAAGTISVNDSGAKLIRTNTRTVGGQSTHEEYAQLAEPFEATYTLSTPTGGIVITTAASHVIQLMAGGTNPLYVHRIQVYQLVLATAAALAEFVIFRLSTAGTGGTSVTPQLFDPSDAAAGATGMTLPTVKGTEGARIWTGSAMITQTVPTAGGKLELFDIDFGKILREKALRIAAGTGNGICVKNVTGVSPAAIAVNIWFTEQAQ